MQNTQQNAQTPKLNAAAQIVCDSLKSGGHDVPCDAILRALEVALDTQNWGAIKAEAELLATSKVIAQDKRTIAASELPGDRVSAKMLTDDGVFSVEFDARSFLSEASEDVICLMVEAGFENDQVMDEVADWEMNSGNLEIRQAFHYLNALQQKNNYDIGFNCSINAVEMMNWLNKNRKQTLANALCKFFCVKLIEHKADGEAGDIGQDWGWSGASGENWDVSFNTKDSAAMGAFIELDLLKDVIEDQ